MTQEEYEDVLAALGFTDEAELSDVLERIAQLLETEYQYNDLCD